MASPSVPTQDCNDQRSVATQATVISSAATDAAFFALILAFVSTAIVLWLHS